MVIGAVHCLRVYFTHVKPYPAMMNSFANSLMEYLPATKVSLSFTVYCSFLWFVDYCISFSLKSKLTLNSLCILTHPRDSMKTSSLILPQLVRVSMVRTDIFRSQSPTHKQTSLVLYTTRSTYCGDTALSTAYLGP